MTLAKPTIGMAVAVVLAGCQGLPPEFSSPRAAYNGAIPTVVATPADDALECLSNTPNVRNSGRVFSVHVISDLTQKIEVEETGGFCAS